MTIDNSVNVRAFRLSELEGLDDITVFLQDLGPGQGRIVVECYGSAWSAYFGAMGGAKGIQGFVRDAGLDYLVPKFNAPTLKGRKRDEDYLRKILAAVKAAL